MLTSHGLENMEASQMQLKGGKQYPITISLAHSFLPSARSSSPCEPNVSSWCHQDLAWSNLTNRLEAGSFSTTEIPLPDCLYNILLRFRYFVLLTVFPLVHSYVRPSQFLIAARSDMSISFSTSRHKLSVHILRSIPWDLFCTFLSPSTVSRVLIILFQFLFF